MRWLLLKSGEELWTRWGAGALTLLAVLLPFEARAPWLRTESVAVTSLELFLYVAIGLCAVAAWRGGKRRVEAIDLAVAGWCVALVASGVAAELRGGEGLKPALRGVSGCLLFFGARGVLRPDRTARRVASSLVAGAALSAILGILDVVWPAMAPHLGAFREAPTTLAGFIRASGPFVHANVAAMYWEATLLVAVALMGGRRAKRWLAGLVVLASAIILSVSRAGVIASGVVLAVCVVGLGRGLARLRRPAGVALIVGLLVLVADLTARPGTGWRFRLRHADGTTWHRASVRSTPHHGNAIAGGIITLQASLQNTGLSTWPATGVEPVRPCVTWNDPDRGTRDVEAFCADLPRTVSPGESVAAEVRAVVPARAGRHVARWVLFGRGIAWWSSRDTRGDVEVRAVDGVASSAGEREPTRVRAPVQAEAGRMELWRSALTLWMEQPIFGVGPDNYRRLYWRSLGPKRLDERTRANSLYLGTLAEVGLAGFAALAAVIVCLVTSVRRTLAAAAPGESMVELGSALALAALLIHGLVDDFLEPTATLVLFWLLLALTVRRQEEGQLGPPRGPGTEQRDERFY